MTFLDILIVTGVIMSYVLMGITVFVVGLLEFIAFATLRWYYKILMVFVAWFTISVAIWGGKSWSKFTQDYLKKNRGIELNCNDGMPQKSSSEEIEVVLPEMP
jgi:hypothetical protein